VIGGGQTPPGELIYTESCWPPAPRLLDYFASVSSYCRSWRCRLAIDRRTGVSVSADWRRERRWDSATRRWAFRHHRRSVPDIRRPSQLSQLSCAGVKHRHEILLPHSRRIR